VPALPPLNSGDGFHARLLTHMHCGSVLVTVKTYRSSFQQGWHEHGVGDLTMVLGGGGVGEYRQGRDPASAGGLGVCGPGVRHRWTTGGEGITSLHAVFLPERVPGLAGVVCDVRDTEVRRGMLRVLREVRAPDASSPLHIESIVHHALERASTASCATSARASAVRGRAAQRWAERALEFLEAATDRSVGLDELASSLGVDRAHLARCIRSSYGRTAGELHRDCRLERAAQLLAGGSESIASVAQRTGFCDQSHMSRAFASRFGIAPSSYRRLMGRWDDDEPKRRTRGR
jgi:AraC family transcriptional regulator